MRAIIIENEKISNRLILTMNWLTLVFAYGLFYLKRMYNVIHIPYLHITLSFLLGFVLSLVLEIWYFKTFKKGKYSPRLKYLIVISLVAVHFTIMAMSEKTFFIGLYFYSIIAAGLYYTRSIMVYSIALNVISVAILVSSRLIDVKFEAPFVAFFSAIVTSFIGCIFVMMIHMTQATRSINTLKKQEEELYNINEKLHDTNVKLNDKRGELLALNESLVLFNNELEKAYLELQHTQDQIIKHEKMASLGELSAGVAHEINNPVGAIKSNMEMYKYLVKELNDKIGEDKTPDIQKKITKMEEVIEVSAQACTRIEQVIKSLKNFARIDHNKKQMINIHTIIESTLVLLNSRLRGRIEVIKQYGNIPDIECFPAQFSQVIMNILQNSIEAIQDRGTIWIITEEAGNQIYIKIKDNGRGIEKEKVEKLFDFDFTKKGKRVGTGLGLATVYRIIQIHNGYIKLDTEEGKGTEVTICLPGTSGMREEAN